MTYFKCSFRELISPSFAMRTFANDGSEVIQEDVADHCHYQGAIRGLKDSQGILDDGKDTFYITPDTGKELDGAHRVFQAKEDDFKHVVDKCGNKETHQADSHPAKENSGTFSRIKRSISNIDEFYKPYLTTGETRYNELLLVVDFRMYKKHNNDTNDIRDRVITLANAVDAIYQRINIRIVMKALEIWTNGDPYERASTGGTDLGRFNTYRRDHLVEKLPHDNAHLLSEWRWSDCAGMAYVFGMCGSVSSGVNNWDFGSIIGPYVILAHEMGHNFGFSHDTGTCKCLTPRGCIMGGHKTRVPGFSNCSMESLKRLNDECLYNVPTYKSYNSYCGNGIREEGEECDCGTPEICMAKDPCCEPHKCLLKKESQCSDLHHSCCKNCLYKKQGSLCRGVKTDCDVPEYCLGDSRDCPEDTYIINGYPCNQTNTVIEGNTNFYSVIRRNLNPRISARYLRINPQYWKDWPCLRTDFMGCAADEVNPSAPTPLKSYGLDLCLTPSTKTCSPGDNDPLVYTGGSCSESHVQFTLGSDGVLRHSCSGKMVCPENGATNNGAKIVVSSSCKADDSKFERTSGRSLKHIKTGRCIHTNGAWPGVGRNMVLWSGCDVQRLELWFMKQECVNPLGMQNGDIKDDQITASSSRPGDLPHYGRLGNKKYWCAAKKSKEEYLQVDLGQIKTVSKILIQGRGTWYNWVTGFFLQYSDDGQRWTGYTESGDKTHSNSVCHLGKCSEIHETQCKELWGSTAKDADKGCYDKLNTEAAGYGTCDPTKNASCAASDVLCGQLQCQDSRDAPVVDYGWTYTKIALKNGKQCSAATLKSIDDIGLGMVRDGTKCGADKMCVNQKCQSFDALNIGKCPKVNNKECGGRGVCTNKKSCHCEGGFDSKDGCASALVARDGGWGKWSSWTICDKGCDGGKKTRYRFCDNPFPLHGGADCPGDRHETEDCHTESCPVVISCRHLRQISEEKNHDYPDGVYKIYPIGAKPVMAFCDMTRDGGGWTLLVTSHTNSWASNNVKLRNADSPKLDDDYSILQYADSIKDNINVAGSKFEYRLEANSRGRWVESGRHREDILSQLKTTSKLT
ncbi:metalloendopeptidase [Desmophyllum pertusum]|uniref:Metalloendopeptidase n=1 Tax=Desmophyllum pertusum TaxID=174260 RepID=A0A9X0D4D8_9CNID|nr:metalloendopeptidase [Desmophyllum pertusum]